MLECLTDWSGQRWVLPAALAFFQRAFAAAEIAALAAELIFLFGFSETPPFPALPYCAILFFTPARIAASPAALSFRLLGWGANSEASTIIVGTCSPKS